MKTITKAIGICPKASVELTSISAPYEAFTEAFVDNYVEFTSMEVFVENFMRVTKRSWKRSWKLTEWKRSRKSIEFFFHEIFLRSIRGSSESFPGSNFHGSFRGSFRGIFRPCELP